MFLSTSQILTISLVGFCLIHGHCEQSLIRHRHQVQSAASRHLGRYGKQLNHLFDGQSNGVRLPIQFNSKQGLRKNGHLLFSLNESLSVLLSRFRQEHD